MRKTIFVEGEFYHLYNRGVDKRVIFTTPREYRRFLAYLYLLNTDSSVRPADILLTHNDSSIFSVERNGNPIVALGAYCLMPNHFHLLITQLQENGISKYMQRVQTAYTMFFNQKHKRSGSLFQGTFKSEYANREVYLKYLFSYIHLNPAKLVEPKWKDGTVNDFVKLKNSIEKYPYSSVREYLSGKSVITDPSKFPEYFLSQKDVKEHIDSWVTLRHVKATREAKPHRYR